LDTLSTFLRAFTPNGKQFIASYYRITVLEGNSYYNTVGVRVFDITAPNAFRQLREIFLYQGNLSWFTPAPDGKTLWTYGTDSDVRKTTAQAIYTLDQWDLTTYRRVKRYNLADLKESMGITTSYVTISGLEFAADGTPLLLFGSQGLGMLYQASGVVTRRIAARSFSNYGSKMALDPTGQILAITWGDNEGTVVLYDAASFREIGQVRNEKVIDGDYGGSLTFTPDGRYLIVEQGRNRLLTAYGVTRDLAPILPTPTLAR
jgi:WD40 repeat protein